MEEKEFNLRNAEPNWKDLYKEHPVRFGMASVIGVLWAIEVLGMQVATFNIASFLISTCVATFFMWIAYGPINLHRARRHKEMQMTAEYILKKNSTSNEQEKSYCSHCGNLVKAEWTCCPKCGKKTKGE